MTGCNKTLEVFVPRGYGYKEITVKCGSTSPDGTPFLCDKCQVTEGHRNWRKEAEEAGETWGDEDAPGWFDPETGTCQDDTW